MNSIITGFRTYSIFVITFLALLLGNITIGANQGQQKESNIKFSQDHTIGFDKVLNQHHTEKHNLLLAEGESETEPEREIDTLPYFQSSFSFINLLPYNSDNRKDQSVKTTPVLKQVPLYVLYCSNRDHFLS